MQKYGESSSYLMGRQREETERLIAASRMLEPFTRRLFLDAGIKKGMRVLDVGCGAGDVSLLVSRIVGPEGSVLGIDQNPEMIEKSRFRAREIGTVAFIEGDCSEICDLLATDIQFDAIVGRLVLMHISDPSLVLRALLSRLRNGGIVAFQEYNCGPETVQTQPHLPLWREANGWFLEVIRKMGMRSYPGFDLRRDFIDAGLPDPHMELSALVGGGKSWLGYEWMAEGIRSLLPHLVKQGIVTEAEVDIDTLATRLRGETVAADGVVKAGELVSATARKQN